MLSGRRFDHAVDYILPSPLPSTPPTTNDPQSLSALRTQPYRLLHNLLQALRKSISSHVAVFSGIGIDQCVHQNGSAAVLGSKIDELMKTGGRARSHHRLS